MSAPLPDAQPLWLVLARPPIAVSTAAVYRALSPQDYATSDDTDAIVQAIQQGEPLPLDRLSNSLEAPVMRDYPEIATTRDALARIWRAACAHERERPHPLCPLRRP